MSATNNLLASAIVVNAEIEIQELRAEVERLRKALELAIEALQMGMQIGDQCSRGFIGKFQFKARAALGEAGKEKK